MATKKRKSRRKEGWFPKLGGEHARTRKIKDVRFSYTVIKNKQREEVRWVFELCGNSR